MVLSFRAILICVAPFSTTTPTLGKYYGLMLPASSYAQTYRNNLCKPTLTHGCCTHTHAHTHCYMDCTNGDQKQRVESGYVAIAVKKLYVLVAGSHGCL